MLCPSFPSCEAGFAQITNPPTPLPPTKGIFAMCIYFGTEWSLIWEPAKPLSRRDSVFKIFWYSGSWKNFFLQFYKVSSSILRPISMKSEHKQRKSIRKRPNKQLKNFWSCLRSFYPNEMYLNCKFTFTLKRLNYQTERNFINISKTIKQKSFYSARNKRNTSVGRSRRSKKYIPSLMQCPFCFLDRCKVVNSSLKRMSEEG